MHMPAFDPFFRDLDAAWQRPTEDRIPLKVLGSAALMLQTNSNESPRTAMCSRPISSPQRYKNVSSGLLGKIRRSIPGTMPTSTS